MKIIRFLQEHLHLDRIWAIVVLAVSLLVISWLVHALIFWLLRKIAAKKGEDSVWYLLVRRLNFTTLILFWTLILLLMIPLLPGAKWKPYLIKIADVLLMLNLGWILIVTVKVILQLVGKRYSRNARKSFRARKILTQIQLLERVLIFLISLVTLALVLMVFDDIRQIGTSLLASAGIAGVIIGVAAQRVLGNILAGIQIALTQPIRINDLVVVEGEFGRVEEITLTFAVINLWDKRRLIVPISFFIEQTFESWTRTSREMLGTVELYVDYSVPVEAMRQEMDRLLEKNPYWNRKSKSLSVTDCTEKCMVVSLFATAKDTDDYTNLTNYLRENMLTFLQKNYSESLPKDRVITK